MKSLKPALSILSLFSGAALTFGAPPAESPYSAPQSPFYGQVRARTEFDDRAIQDTVTKKGLLYTLLRTRLGFVAVPSPAVEVKVEVQDSRFFGQEPVASATNPASATTGDFAREDLEQGYFAIEEGDFKTALGRQKMTLGSGRFLSTLEWNNVSRAFDGWSFNYKVAGGAGNLTGMAFLVKDTSMATVQDHDLLSGLYYSHAITPDIGADAYAFYEQDRLPETYSGEAAKNFDLEYYGLRSYGKAGMFTWDGEFIWQGGEVLVGAKDLTSEAFQLSARAGVVLGGGAFKINAGLDMMSGDKDSTDNTTNLYRANYYFGHALYGWMDYLDINPKYGEMDYRVDADLGFLPNAMGNPRVTLKPQYHYFTPQNAPSGKDDPYGQEFDLEAHVALYPKSNIVFGAGLFIPGDGYLQIPNAGVSGANTINEVGTKLNATSKTENGIYLYFMPTFNF